jgi:selenocysteine lyase/cysteine desulfurase
LEPDPADVREAEVVLNPAAARGTDGQLYLLQALRLHKTLWEQRIITRYVPERNGIRISTPCFTSEEELVRLIAALERVRGESGR